MATDQTKLEELFEAARARPADQRRAYLDEACADDTELRCAIDSLLEAHDAAGQFLESAAGGELDPPILLTPPGTIIGRYKLLEPIGEGGYGVVFMAEQMQPVQRRVALKIIKAGMDTRQVIARFEAERQALALMDHPNIARVFDAGTTDTGRPYFVMELVKGTPITKYCDEHHIEPRQRLELFMQVCQAVQHAHQKGIIHRDLKPSNVLVAQYDGKPVPKVIDFGVAKATGQQLTERTMFTGFGDVIGTPEYMSPEQAELNQLDIDTRSDIYSLGVLLYELLTGTTPLEHRRVREAALLEVLRVIREEEPPKPSTRLSTVAELPSIAAQRGVEPKKLSGLVYGELDWIVMKALEKDRNRRYETANGFAMDVQRYLADEPVLACPPSMGYRLRKFARRNKAALAFTGLVLLTILTLTGGIAWNVRDRAARAAERANHLERAVERAELLQREGKRGQALAALERAQLLAREAESAPALARRIDSLKQLLDAEERDDAFVSQFARFRDEVRTEVDVEQSTFRKATEAFPKLREIVEQYGIAIGVTSPAAAVTHIQKRPAAIQTVVLAALDECLSLVPKEDAGTREWLIDVLQKGDSDPWRNKVRRASKQLATLEALAKDIDVRHQPPSFLLLVVKALPIESPSRLDLARRVQFAYPGDFWANHEEGWILWNTKEPAEAVRYYTAALALRPDNPGVLLNRAIALRDAGELEAAISDLQRAIALAPRYAAAHNHLGNALRDQNKLDEAIASYQEAFRLAPKDPLAPLSLGYALSLQGKRDEAIAEYRKVIDIDPKSKLAADAYFRIGKALEEQGKLDEAIAAYTKAIELDPKFARAYNGLGTLLSLKLRESGKAGELSSVLDKHGSLQGVVEALRTAVEDAEKTLHDSQDSNRAKDAIGHQLRYLAFALADLHRHADAEEAFQKAAKVFEVLSAKEPDNPGHLHFIADNYLWIGKVRVADKRVQDGEKAYRQALEIHESRAARFPDFLRNESYNRCEWITCYLDLASLLASGSRNHEAKAIYERALERFPDEALVNNRFAWFLAVCPDPGLRDPAQALQLAKRALQLWPAERSYLPGYHRALDAPYLHAGTNWTTLGVAHYRAGQWKEAVAALEKSMERRLDGDSFDWFFLAMARWRLGEKDKSRESYDRAVQWMDKNQPKNEELLRFRAETEELMKKD